MSLALTYPNEGQILYAGPGVPRYVIPVTGRVSLPQGDPSTVQLSVDVFQGSEKLGGFTARPEATGNFEFLVTVRSGQVAGTIDLPGTSGATAVVHAVAQPSGQVYTATTRS
jgi:hypothetical protein